MSREPAWRRYLRFFRPDPESDIRDELDFHVELMADRLEAEGLSRDEALRRARREFGDRAAAEAACRDIAEDRERRGRWRRLADDAREDLRYGIRQLRRSPGFAALAILTLALGVGATTAIFSVVDGVLIRPLPFRESDRLVRLFEVAPTGEQSNPIAAANLADWRSRVRSFGTVGAHAWPYTLVLSGLEAPARVEVVRTEPEVFRILGVAPILGRTLLEDDDASVVVVSGGLWKSRLGGDPGVVGRSLVIDGVARTVVGVMPPDFSFPASRVDVWFPLGPGEFDFTNRRSHNWGAVARLRPGVTLAAADAELRGIVRSLSTEYPAFLKDWSARVVPLKDDLVGPVRPVLVALLAGVALVLVIACANLANLFLARALTRGREIAVRTALGAERGRLIRQLMTELGVLATVAGVIGVALAAGLLRGLLALAPADLPRLGEVGLDPAALGFAVAVTVASTLAFGLAPAFASARADGALTLRTEAGRSSGTGQWRVRSAMLVAEVALSLMLLTGAGLLVRSFLNARSVDLGFRPDRWLAATVDPAAARRTGIAGQIETADRIEAALRAVPGVAAVTAITREPASGSPMTFSFAIEGRPSPNPSGRFDPEPLQLVRTGYFVALGIPMLRGREFLASDRADTPPVAVVSAAFARKYWPGDDPIGRRFAFREDTPWIEVVGVAGDVIYGPADGQVEPEFYLPAAQRSLPWLTWQTFLIEAPAGRDPAAFERGVLGALASVDPTLSPSRLAPVSALYAESVGRRTFAMILLTAFAGAAVALGLVGLYGVLAASVTQRRQEIAVRMALGATRGAVVALVLGQALRVTAIGLVIGAVGAGLMTRLLQGLLFQVSPLDPAVFAAGAAVLAVAALVAAFVPARRAASVTPVRAFRGP